MSPILQGLANGSVRGYGGFFGAATPPAFESIATATGTGSSGTITFNSISGSYQFLQIRGLMKCDDTGTDFVQTLQLTFNGDNGANYAYHVLRGDGTTANTNFAGSSANFIQLRESVIASWAGQANNHSAVIIDIHDYASTTKAKTVRTFFGSNNNNTSTNYKVALTSGLWTSTSAITSITLKLQGNFFTNTTQFALYGIKGAA